MLPHVNDTLLLLAAIGLSVVQQQYPFVHGWVTAKVLGLLPTSAANSKDALQFNIGFWADQGEALEKRFSAWAAQ